MRDDDSSTKGSEFSAETNSSSQPKKRLGIGRGRPPKTVPSVSDSGLGPSASSQGASVGDSRSVSSQAADCESRGEKGSFSEVFTDADEFLTCTEDEQGDRELRFSNINCLFFGELQRNAFKVYRYIASFEPTLSTKDKKLFLLKKVVVEKIGDTLLSPPSVLYAAQQIPEHAQVFEEKLHGQTVKLRLTPSDQPRKLEDFFTCLLKRMSLFLTTREAFMPLSLLSHEKRFEVYPGDAVDVAERECIVRCSTNFNLNIGKVEDIIEECLIYSAVWGEDQTSYHEIVERNLRDLIVLNESDNRSYVVERILWDDYLIRCRQLKTETTRRIRPDKLVLSGSRRIAPTARDSVGTDKALSFLGSPASGQRRQLAMVRYKEIMQQERPSSYLQKWKILLNDTAVVSNNVLLQSDVLRMQGDASNLISSVGWVDRLSNLKVLVPVRVRNWYVIFEKGDERIVKYMIENLRCDAPTIGIEMSEPRKKAITDTSKAAYESTLRSCLSQNPNVELFMVVVRSTHTDVYNTVKNWSLSQSRPIATQIVLRDTVKQICSVLDTSLSVITQINCKLGGALWTLDRTINNTLVIGLSMYTSADGKDVLGFVSSRNNLFTQWYSYAIMDVENELREQLRTAVRKYSLENEKKPPERMIVLSNQITDEDFPARIITSVKSVFDGKLALVHVEDIERFNEIILGLAEEGKINEIQETQKKYIFVPQRVEKELDMICCRLDFNNTGLSPKEIAGVIKQLKHVYYNVAGEVNLPAPVLYADRCAEFVADVLDGVQSENIRDKLYYL